ncbi:hypothetical protein KCU65_g5661, partial [Aureobasidium melanogenum]
MSSEPSSPALVDPQAQEIETLKGKIKDLKEKLAQRDDSFAYYERSNQELQEQNEEQTLQLEEKDLIITKLKAHIEAHKKEHEETTQENKKLRRQSSHFEEIVKANEKELRNLPDLEKAIEDREAEVRNFTAELDLTRTERDDKITETKGLEGDIANLRQELETKEEEIDILHEKLDIFERHITISKDLPAEELDDVLYDFMEKWSAMQADGPSPPKKNKRASLSGMNLSDEFEALSDDGYDSEDGGYASDDRSIRSLMSERPAKKKLQQALEMSEIESVAIHPSIKKPVEMASAGTQMSPKPMPKNVSNATQTSPVESPKKIQTTNAETQTSPVVSPKKSFSQVISNGVQTSPIAALIQKFTPTMVDSSAQTIPSPRKSFSEVLSTGVQTSPITPALKERKPFSEVMTSGVQTSPVAASMTKVTSPLETFTFSGTSSGVSTSPIAPSPKTAAPETAAQTSPTASSPSNVPLPPSPAFNSPVTGKPSTESPLSNEITQDQLTLNDVSPSQPGKPSKTNTLNIKRPRIPTKDMSPATHSHWKAVTAPSDTKTSSSTANTPSSHDFDLHTLLTSTLQSLPTLYQTITTDIHTHRRFLLLCLAASYLGFAIAFSAAEYSWAHANGKKCTKSGVSVGHYEFFDFFVDERTHQSISHTLHTSDLNSFTKSRSLTRSKFQLLQPPRMAPTAKTALLRLLIRFLTTSFRPLAIFWLISVVLMSLYQVLNPTSAHNVGVTVDPLAALMQEFAFRVSVLFPNLNKTLLSLFYTALQSLGIILIFICLSLIYIPLRFLFWIGSIIYYDLIFAKVPPTASLRGGDGHGKSGYGHGDGEGEKRRSRIGEWIDTPETSPLQEGFGSGQTDKETETEIPSTPLRSTQSEAEAGSERIDSVMRGGDEGVSTSRFSGMSPEFRAKYSLEEK